MDDDMIGLLPIFAPQIMLLVVFGVFGDAIMDSASVTIQALILALLGFTSFLAVLATFLYTHPWAVDWIRKLLVRVRTRKG